MHSQGLILLFQLKRAGIELIIESVLPDEILVVAPLDDAPTLQHHDGVGVADGGEPVGDTENFNGLPDDYPKGYDDNSPVNLAHLFRDDSTRLLIVHGTADDNVHFQNTMEMARALNKLGKQYDMMVYPDQNHSMMPDDMIHVREKMLRYTLENL